MKEIPAPLAAELADRCRVSGCGVVRILPPASRDAGSESAGGEGDRETRNELEATFRGPLPDVIALLASVRLFMGSDSGILHLATAVGTPALGLYGSTVPELGFSPLGNAAIGVDLPCRPCHAHGARRCWLGHRRCWVEQSPDWIWEEGSARLGQATRGA
jgi:heptosyltransferase-2